MNPPSPPLKRHIPGMFLEDEIKDFTTTNTKFPVSSRLFCKESPPSHLQAKLWAGSPAIRPFEVQEASFFFLFKANNRERTRPREERGREAAGWR